MIYSIFVGFYLIHSTTGLALILLISRMKLIRPGGGSIFFVCIYHICFSFKFDIIRLYAKAFDGDILNDI